jgi:hypothetical protein
MKRASLSLSVNAIVILILAVAMLGLGLGFMKGMFSKTSIQVEQAIEQEPSAPETSGTPPISLSRETIITEPGEVEALKVRIHNPGSTTLNIGGPVCGGNP